MGFVQQVHAAGALLLVPGHTLLRQLAENTHDPGVSILDIVHRVVVGLGLGQVQVEVHVLLAFAHDIEEARRVVAHFLAQLAQGDEFAGACGHLHLLATAIEDGELHQQHVQLGGVVAQGGQRGLHARHIAVMVGAPDVDDTRITALQLVHVVGDVGSEVGLLAVFAHHHPVLLITEFGGAKPERALLLVDVAAGLEALDGLVHDAAFREGTLREPFIVFHPEFLQVLADVGENGIESLVEQFTVALRPQQLLGASNQGIDVFFLVTARRRIGGNVAQHLLGSERPVVAVVAVEGGTDVPDIVTLVTVAGEGQLHASQFQVTQVDTGGEDIHLPARIIDVVFTVHVETHGTQQVRHRGAIGGAAAVAHVQRAGGIGGHEFHLHRLAPAQLTATVVGTAFEDLSHHAMPGIAAEVEVDETGTGDFHLADLCHLRQCGHQGLGDVARLAPRHPGQGHGQVAGEISMAAVTGTLHQYIDRVVGGNHALGLQGRVGLRQELRQLLLHGKDSLRFARFRARRKRRLLSLLPRVSQPALTEYPPGPRPGTSAPCGRS